MRYVALPFLLVLLACPSTNSWVRQTQLGVTLRGPGTLKRIGELPMKLAEGASGRYTTYVFEEANTSWELHVVEARNVPGAFFPALRKAIKRSAVSIYKCQLTPKRVASDVHVGSCVEKNVKSTIWLRFLEQGRRIAFTVVRTTENPQAIEKAAVRFARSAQFLTQE